MASNRSPAFPGGPADADRGAVEQFYSSSSWSSSPDGHPLLIDLWRHIKNLLDSRPQVRRMRTTR